MKQTLMRLTTALAILSGSAFYSAAQQHYSSNISIGAKAGATLSRTMFAPSVDQKMSTGFMAGLMMRYMEEKHFGIIIELNAEQRGWKENIKETAYSFNRKLTYLQIPMLAHIYFGSPRAKFFFNAGPEIGFLVGDHTSSNFNYRDVASIPDFPLTNRNIEQYTMDISHKIDYGISAGLGLEIASNKHNSFLLEGRAYYGLNNIFSAHKKDVFAASNGLSIMVSLGYFFRVK